jgi:hypothetical protein
MPQKETLTRVALKTPRAAAIAGFVFSILMILIFWFWLLRISVPADPLEPGAWLTTSSRSVSLALNLVPFAGIAFLWFLGALRDRLGHLEDRFFATVFFGSALLFLAMFFTAAAIVGALVIAFASRPDQLINTNTFQFARAVAFNIMNVYAIKMAGVFMISTSTVVTYTGIAPRWIAILGYVLASILLLGSSSIDWGFVVLPIWVFLISIYILIDNFRLTDRIDQDSSNQ